MFSSSRSSSAHGAGLPPEVEPGGRPPDAASTDSSTRVGGSRQSASLLSAYQDAQSGSPERTADPAAPADSTVFNSGGSSSTRTVMQGSAWSHGLSRAPQSSFLERDESPGRISPTTVALSAKEERREAASRAATTSPSRGTTFYSAADMHSLLASNVDIRNAFDALVAAYNRKRECIDLDKDGIIVLESEGGRPDEDIVDEKLVSLEDRVAMLRDMEFSSKLIEYADASRTRVVLKEGSYALFENVANNLSQILQACFSELPWAGVAAWPPDEWYANYITCLARPFPTVGRLARAFNAAQGWIDHVAGIVEVHLRFREPDALPPRPRSFSKGLDHYASFGTPARKKTSDEGSEQVFQASPPDEPSKRWTPKDQAIWRRLQSSSPAPVEGFYERTVSRNVVQARRVTLGEPTFIPSTPQTTAESYLEDPRSFGGTRVVEPRNPDLLAGVGTPRLIRKPRPSAGDSTLAGHLTLREAVTDAASRPLLPSREPWREEPPHAHHPDESREEVSRQLDVLRSTLSPRGTRADDGRAFFEHAHPQESAAGGRSRQHFAQRAPMSTQETADARGAQNVPLRGGAFFNSGHGSFPDWDKGYGNGGGGGGAPGRSSGGIGPDGGGLGGNGSGGGGNGGGRSGGGWPNFPPSGGGGGGRPPAPPGPPGGGGQPPAPPGPPGGGGQPPAPPGGGGGAPPPDANNAGGPRIDVKFRVDALPSWDGSASTALTYFAELRRWAELGGTMPQQLGMYAPLRFKAAALEWWETISWEARQYLRRDIYTLIAGIRHGVLTNAWVRNLTIYCNTMEFRQPGYAQESPAAFLRRRAMIVNALYHFSEEEQVSYILSCAPVPWMGVLADQHIYTVADLLLKAAEMEPQLLQAALMEGDVERRVQKEVDRLLRSGSRQFVRRSPIGESDRNHRSYQRPPPARAHLVDVEEDVELVDLSEPRGGAWLPIEDTYDPVPQLAFKSSTVPVNEKNVDRARQIHAFLSTKKKAPPPGGYPFPKYEHVSKPPPPFDCRFCGGQHWHKECIHKTTTSSKSSAMIATHDLPAEEDLLYAIAEDSALMQSRSTYVSLRDSLSQDPDLAPDESWIEPLAIRFAGEGDSEELRAYKASCVEEEDCWNEWERTNPGLSSPDDPLLLEDQPRRNAFRERSPQAHSSAPYVRDLIAYSPPGALKELESLAPLPPDYTDGYQPAPSVKEARSRAFLVDERKDVLVVDDEFDVWYRASPKARRDLLEPGGDGFAERTAQQQAAVFAAAMSAEFLPPPVREIELIPRRRPPDGHSSVGVGVLSTPGKLGSASEETIVLRLDSGASISLVAEEYLKQMKDPPKIRTGLRIEIAQLTDQSPRIKGYVSTCVRVKALDGTMLVLEAELYVVPGMTVPVLLGEDFQLNYELNVLRNVELGTKVQVGDSGFSFSASSTADGSGESERRASRLARGYQVIPKGMPAFVAAKQHRRQRANRQRRKRATANGALRAWEDVLIPAETTTRVPISGDLQQGREWYVERYLVPQADESFLTVPNTLLDLRTTDAGRVEPGSIARCSLLPVSNPTKVPRLLRAGTLLGYAKDPQEYLTVPRSEDEYREMRASAEALAALASELQNADGSAASAPESNPTTAEAPGLQSSSKLEQRAREKAGIPCVDELRERPGIQSLDPGTADELQPPAVAEAPDPEVYSSADMEKHLDISPDVPAVYRKQALELFRKHVLAFGFDGRLGELDANAKIRTKEGVEPISLPMHGASPEKRKVIEEQLSKWFELGVIEDSVSPWGAPVVIVYRNRKARFCVDYRKLNAATVRDEFPIPRQTDVLAALSGSQVLSSLDALAGFNQMNIAPDDIEKTAFRTHKGLFQFRRMPFGLRNGPAIFQRVMQGILSPFLWIFTLVYIDDIVVYSKSYEEHLVHLDKVLGAVARSGLTLAPTKCHFMYSSILLLGHKVSRLGLSTHEEKVSAIMEIERPQKVQTLQVFLGMVVYFQAFIPYYSFIVSPLFRLLKKGVKWHWGEEQEHAFQEVKKALQAAPVLGHPVANRPYRLYTDASDEALGACLQQVQEIRVGDLAGTPAYERLRAAHDAGAAVPILCTRVSTRTNDVRTDLRWADNFDDTVVETERVISYWSRTFKSAERNYSATEREALAAKDALIKFQPYIEGERIILITDHSSLQWARTFENANRRLAAWGLVFAAYPYLEIVHRAGRLHSNVDPLSRLPRDVRTQRVRGAPAHTSPAKDTTPAIHTDYDLAELRELAAAGEPAPRMAFADLAFRLDDLLEEIDQRASGATALAVTRSAARRLDPPPETSVRGTLPKRRGQRANQDAEKLRYEDRLEWEARNPPPTLLVSMSPELRKRYVEGYSKDPAFKDKGLNSDERAWYPGNRFYRDKDGLLFFRDADLMPRLCVPKSEQRDLVQHIHESEWESAHAGPAKTYMRVIDRFYWPRMRVDIEAFVKTCDVCQKTKDPNFTRFGKLQPQPIPRNPYERISLDLVTGLPWSGSYNAVLVIVDILTKHAQFIPTDTGLDTERFATLFIRHVVSRFGVPVELIADRDGRWLSKFFDAVSRQLGVHMMLSSAHHPQHDGQTERTNRTMETMLRSYASTDPQNWSDWLPALEFAYNTNPHASTGDPPYKLLYGFEPRAPTDLLVPSIKGDSVARGVTAHAGADTFLEAFEARRHAARDSIALAQHRQAQAYNSGRRELVFEPGQLVLLRPKSLQLVEAQGEGAKLVQRAFGPFAVQERVNDSTYRIDLPDTFPMSNVIHISHLRKYESSPDQLGDRTRLPAPRWDQSASEEYQVERIISHRRNRKKGLLEYLVRWEGYGPAHDEWLTARELRNAPARLLDYRRTHNL